LDCFQHHFKRFALYACQTFEIRLFELFDRLQEV